MLMEQLGYPEENTRPRNHRVWVILDQLASELFSHPLGFIKFEAKTSTEAFNLWCGIPGELPYFITHFSVMVETGSKRSCIH